MSYKYTRISVRRKVEVVNFLKIYMSKDEPKLRKKLNTTIILKRNKFLKGHRLKIRCKHDLMIGDNNNNTNLEREKKKDLFLGENKNGKMDDENTGKDLGGKMGGSEKGLKKKKKKRKRKKIKKEQEKEIEKAKDEKGEKEEEKCKKKESKIINKDLLNNIKENETQNTRSNTTNELEDENFNLLNQFKVHEDNTLVSELTPAKSKELINCASFKKLMVELNLKEKDVLRLIKKNENSVSTLINQNLSLEQIKNKAQNEEAQNEELFGTFMNNDSSKIGNIINFKKVSKEYKEIIREVILLFLGKKVKFSEIIKQMGEKICDMNNYCLSILKENILFKELNNETLNEIIKKSVLIGHLNEKFSNDAQNFEWTRQIENYIFDSINNANFKVKEISYSSNTINVSVTCIKNVSMDSNEYDDIECSIHSSLEQYEKANNLDILSFFKILVNIS
ncbi:conserved Plasmodium protein, unknown function [Plasmodium malariae]|uniref:Uncharacterized protein n=1 Tax=Plasmodium malariae TaxID=5858 RepID=A0A1C3KFK7_PLAMA|nr:conserved Plasmodium protein, unknown function [Plasmodium malariae]